MRHDDAPVPPAIDASPDAGISLPVSFGNPFESAIGRGSPEWAWRQERTPFNDPAGDGGPAPRTIYAVTSAEYNELVLIQNTLSSGASGDHDSSVGAPPEGVIIIGVQSAGPGSVRLIVASGASGSAAKAAARDAEPASSTSSSGTARNEPGGSSGQPGGAGAGSTNVPPALAADPTPIGPARQLAAAPNPSALTPLAQTPGASGAAQNLAGGAAPAGSFVGAQMLGASTSNASSGISGVMTRVGIAITPGGFPFVAAALSDEALIAQADATPGVQTATGVLGAVGEEASPVARLIAAAAMPESFAGAAYNFIHFNPASLLNDAIARFVKESATLSTVDAVASYSSARALTITAAVLGFDAVFLGYWYHLARRDRAAGTRRPQPWGDHVELCQRRVL